MKVKNCSLLKPLSCGKGTSIVEAAKILRDNKQRRLIVVDDEGYPAGIISTTDMNNKIIAESLDPKTLKAEDIMNSPIFLICDFEDDLGKIYEKMHMHESFFVPVVKEKKLYGILTYGELMHQVSEVMKNGKRS